MKRLALLAAMALTTALCRAQLPDPEYHFNYAGADRTYWLHIPKNMKPGAPLVIMLHGSSGKVSDREFDPVSDKHGFAYCYPLGTEYNGHHFWNVGYDSQAGMTSDDVGFLEALVGEIHSRFGTSTRNVFLTGFSNGGEMCYVVAEMKPKLFAAYASLAGIMMEWVYKKSASDVAVPFMEVHGTLDPTNRWCGDPYNKYGSGVYLSVPFAVEHHVLRNHCTQLQCDTLPFRDGPYPIVAHRWTGSKSGKDVWLYEIQGGQHGFACKQEMDEQIWQFFSKYITEE